MKILVDTNVIIDILSKREPFFSDSFCALKHAVENDDSCIFSAAAVTDVFYILRKHLGSQRAKEKLCELSDIISVVDVTAQDIQAAMNSPLSDFEDAVVSAVALRCNADIILTRNVKDFENSLVRAVLPQSYLYDRIYV